MDAVFLNGALTFTNAGEIRFGAAAGTDPATVTAIDGLYTRCGIAHTVEDDIAHRMWAKLMLNDGINQTCMAYGARTEAPRNRLRAASLLCLRHARDACGRQRRGYRAHRGRPNADGASHRGLDPAGMPSMAQDRVAQRKTEVEEFAGTVRRLAAKHDIQAPQNEWLYRRIRDIEASW